MSMFAPVFVRVHLVVRHVRDEVSHLDWIRFVAAARPWPNLIAQPVEHHWHELQIKARKERAQESVRGGRRDMRRDGREMRRKLRLCHSMRL